MTNKDKGKPHMVMVYNVLLLIGILLGIVFLHDILQRKHTILRNFPIVGHIRYLFELIGPELRQYWVATDKEETPFNRSERSWIYATAKKQNNATNKTAETIPRTA